MSESELKPKPRISMIVPLPVSLLLIVFFFLPWLTISCEAGEFTKAMQRSGALEAPPTSPMPAVPEVSAEIGHASGWQLAQGDISLKAACARQDSPAGSDKEMLKNRPLLYMGLALPVLMLLLSGLGATGNANAGKVGAGLLLLGIVGAATILMAASIDYVDDAMDKAQEEATKSSCCARGSCPMAVENAKTNMKKLIKTKGTVYLWASLGMYVLLAGCGIAARSTPLNLDFQREPASVPAFAGSISQERVRSPSAEGLPDFGPALTPKEPARETEDAAVSG